MKKELLALILVVPMVGVASQPKAQEKVQAKAEQKKSADALLKQQWDQKKAYEVRTGEKIQNGDAYQVFVVEVLKRRRSVALIVAEPEITAPAQQ